MKSEVKPLPADRRTYLIHCARISISKRWYWPAAAFIATLTISLMAQLQTAFGVSLALLAAILVLLWIALDSWRRHAGDFY